MYFESHAHYDDSRFKDDFSEVIQRLRNEKVSYVINVGAHLKSSKASIALAKKYDFFHCSVGVHPHHVEDMVEGESMTILKEYVAEKKVVAIGEIGLDYYYEHSPKDSQRYWFTQQLNLANEVNLPVIIHSREADQECFDLIKKADIKKKGVIHCYSGSKELAQEYVKMGYYIGVGGVITFQNARKLVETVKEISIDHLLIETDCPYLAPIPHRGKRNDSTNLKYIVEMIANIKNMTPDEISQSTTNNGIRLFL